MPNLSSLPNQPDQVASDGFNLIYFFRQWTTLARIINAIVSYLNTLVIPGAYVPPTPTQTVTSNVFATIYQNTNSTPRLVFITVGTPGMTGGTATVKSDNSSTPSTVIGGTSAVATSASPAASAFSFEVLPGNYYEVTRDVNLTITYWVECN